MRRKSTNPSYVQANQRERETLPPLDFPGLTAREKEIVTLAGTLRDHDLAAALGISYWTVKGHLKAARMKYKYGGRQDVSTMDS